MQLQIKKLINNNTIYRFIAMIYHNILSLPYYIFRIFPIKKNKIVLCSYYGKDYGDNPKYIADEILNQNIDIELIWLLKKDLVNKNNIPKQIKVVKYGSLRAIFELSTAKVWIDNSRKMHYVKKRKEQYYIQCWHGILPLKKIEYNARESLTNGYIKSAINDSKNANLMLMGIGRNENEFRKTFWYDGEILDRGIPKLDFYFKHHDVSQIKSKLGIKDERILLYAPTFRKNNELDVYDLDFNRCKEVLEESTGDKWSILLRLHPNVSLKLNNQNVIDVTSYGDIQELIYLSDYIITDYSGLMFESIVHKKPCFLYASDIEDYVSDRGFNYKLNELPFYLSRNNEELCSTILSFDKVKYNEKINDFIKKHGELQNDVVSPIIVDKIKSQIGIN